MAKKRNPRNRKSQTRKPIQNPRVRQTSQRDSNVSRKGSTKRASIRDRKALEQQSKFDGKQLLITLAYIAGIVLTGVVLYAPVFDFKLVFCDDNIFVLDYQAFNAQLDNLWSSFRRTFGTTYYRPILNWSFIIDANISEAIDSIKSVTDPRVYHMSNVFIHVIATSLIFIGLVRVGFNKIAAFALSMLMIAHPILTPAASWISGRNDSLITVSVLLSFIFLVNFLNSTRWYSYAYNYVLHLIFFAFSIFTKEIGGVFPLICFLYIWMYRKESAFATRNFILLFGWVLVILIWYQNRAAATANIVSPDTIGLDALVKNYPTIFALIGKIFLPIKMIALSNFEMFSILSGVAVILIITGIFVFNKDLQKSKALFGVLWFAIFLVPTLMVRIIYVDDFFDYAEHRAYLPLFGVFIMLLEMLRSWKIDYKKPIFISAISVIFIAFLAKSFTYQNVFYDRVTFWTHMTEMYPWKSRGYLDLGKAYFTQNKLQKAEELYLKGIDRNPNNFNLFIDVSAVYMKQGKIQKAIDFARHAVRIDPKNQLANYNLGKSLMSVGKFEEAANHLNIAVTIQNPKIPLWQWYYDLGVCYYKTKQFQKALDAYRQSVGRNQKFALGYSNMAACFAALNKREQAEQNWLRAIQLNPKISDPYNNLIRVYQMTGRTQQARQIYAQAAQNKIPINPNIRQMLAGGGAQ